MSQEKEKPVKAYIKEEKLKMFDITFSKLLKDLKAKRDFTPFLEITDEHSGYLISPKSARLLGSEIGGTFKEIGLEQLNENVTLEEILKVLRKGSKEVRVPDTFGHGSVDFWLVENRFEYHVSFYFLSKEGRWIVRDIARLRPERE
ncbi:hypothetical protein [Leptospira licerasiae]|uniref:hypothetical protein n=1 Tax=Leptospira licerasiae TaxID=447106 RepID=UPI001083414D|nr:hypothetical protein [Leptospira licerasiae]TGM87912.1 hypothetical protein EHR05_14765 [Leptospira licerasiae]